MKKSRVTAKYSGRRKLLNGALGLGVFIVFAVTSFFVASFPDVLYADHLPVNGACIPIMDGMGETTRYVYDFKGDILLDAVTGEQVLQGYHRFVDWDPWTGGEWVTNDPREPLIFPPLTTGGHLGSFYTSEHRETKQHLLPGYTSVGVNETPIYSVEGKIQFSLKFTCHDHPNFKVFFALNPKDVPPNVVYEDLGSTASLGGHSFERFNVKPGYKYTENIVVVFDDNEDGVYELSDPVDDRSFSFDTGVPYCVERDTKKNYLGWAFNGGSGYWGGQIFDNPNPDDNPANGLDLERYYSPYELIGSACRTEIAPETPPTGSPTPVTSDPPLFVYIIPPSPAELYPTDNPGNGGPLGFPPDPTVDTGTCSDGMQNGDETGVDTGGRCGTDSGGGGGFGDIAPMAITSCIPSSLGVTEGTPIWWEVNTSGGVSDQTIEYAWTGTVSGTVQNNDTSRAYTIAVPIPSASASPYSIAVTVRQPGVPVAGTATVSCPSIAVEPPPTQTPVPVGTDTVTVVPLSVTCDAYNTSNTPITTANIGQTVVWKANPQAAAGSVFSYIWNGPEFTSSQTASTVNASYTTAGLKSVTLALYSGGVHTFATCSVTVANVAPVAPIVTVVPPSCDVGVGQLNISWNAVPNAISYVLYRSTSPFVASKSNWATVAYADTVVNLGTFATPPTPFVDRNLNPGQTYYYQAKAIGNGGVASPASSAVGGTASMQCPDLVVPTITPVPTLNPGTPVTFSAVVRNVGGTLANTFDNTFTVVKPDRSRVTLPFLRLSHRFSLVAGGSQSLTSSSWTSQPGTGYTIEVCSDTSGEVREYNGYNGVTDTAETNNCRTLSFNVNSYPNLQSTLTFTGDPVPGGYATHRTVILSGSVKNVSGGQTLNTQFYNRYSWAYGSLPSSPDGWSAFTPDMLLNPATSMDPNGALHPAQEMAWGQNGAISAGGPWYFQFCADNLSAESESIEGDNCSTVGPITFVDVPEPDVDLRWGASTGGSGSGYNTSHLINVNDSGYFSWSTVNVPTGGAVCTATRTLGVGTWSGTKPNNANGYSSIPLDGYLGSSYTSGPLSTRSSFAISCPGLVSPLVTADTITLVPLDLSCSANKTNIVAGDTVVWTASVNAPGSSVDLAWEGSDIPTSPVPTNNPYSIVYTTAGTKEAWVTATIRDVPALSRKVKCATSISVINQPDLVVSAGPTLASSPKLGQTVTINATIKNQGQAGVTVSPFYNRFQLLNSAGTAVAVGLNSPTVSGGLSSPNGTRAVSVSWTPNALGTYIVQVCADTDGAGVTTGSGANNNRVSNELNESNNCAVSSTPFTVEAPDLTASIDSIASTGGESGTVRTGGIKELYPGNINITGYVSNKTTATADSPANFYSRAEYSQNGGPWIPHLSLRLPDDSTGMIDIGEARSIGNNTNGEMIWNTPVTDPTYYAFRLCANRDISVVERDDSDTSNCSAPVSIIVVKKPALTVKSTRDGVASTGVNITSSQDNATRATEFTISQTSAISTTLTAPATDPAGAKFLSWSCTNGTPNNTARTCAVTVLPGGNAKTVTANYAKPNYTADSLTVTGLTAIPGGYRYGFVTLQAKVNNTSSVMKAPGTIQNAYYQSNNGTNWNKIGNSKPLINTTEFDAPASGRLMAVSDSYAVNTLQTLYFKACADDPHAVFETDEGDNCTATAGPYAFLGQPDLTASIDSIASTGGESGTVRTGGIKELYPGNINITGYVSNKLAATADSPANFYSRAEYSQNGGPWIPHLSLRLPDDSTGMIDIGEARSIGNNTNGEMIWNTPVTDPTYYAFRLCANRDISVVERDDSDTSNCSAPVSIIVVKKPALTVKSTRDGVASTGAGGTSSQTNVTYTTQYSIVQNTRIATTLTADQTDSAGAIFTSWDGCDPNGTNNTERTCFVSVETGANGKTVTANYITPLGGGDVLFEGREAGTNNAWQTGVLNQISIPIGHQPELHWQGARCISADASSDPATAWSGTKGINGAIQTETVATTFSRVGLYTFRLSCVNAVSSFPKLVVVNFTAPDLTASLSTPAGTKNGSTYISGQNVTLSGTITNGGTAPTPNGDFTNVYQYSVNGSSWFSMTAYPFAPGNRTSLSNGLTRALPTHTIAGGGMSPGSWSFRVCADQDASTSGYSPSRGTIPEDNSAHGAETEGSNCSSAQTITVSTAPTLTVRSTKDGAFISGLSVTGTQAGTGGSTEYSVVKTDGDISTTLTVLENALNARFTGWTCVGGTANGQACTVSVSVGQNKMVTANYVTDPDLTATAPTVSCSQGVTGDPSKCYAGTTMTLNNATVTNGGTRATPTGIFKNSYEYSTDGGSSWYDFSDTAFTDQSVLVSGATRAVPPYSWGQDGSIGASPLVWQFRVCADQAVDSTPGYTSGAGTISEWNSEGTGETNNCSPSTSGKTIIIRPILSVDLKVNGSDGPIELPVTPGQSPTLSWTTQFPGYTTPDSCTGSIDWSGGKAVTTGSQVVGPLSSKPTYDYKITCTKTDAIPVEDTVRVRIAPTVSCRADRNPIFADESVIWNASVNSVTQYVLSWSGTDGLSGSADSVQKRYITSGEKSASVSVTADGITKSATCSVPARPGDPGDRPTLTVKAFPDLTANRPDISGSTPVAGATDTYYERTTLTISGSINNIGTKSTPTGGFNNSYQYTTVDTGTHPADTDSRWFNWVTTFPTPGSVLDASTSGRALGRYTWGQDGSIAPGTWYFRVCADAPQNQVTEEHKDHNAEVNNCSDVRKVTIVARPVLKVDLKVNGSDGPIELPVTPGQSPTLSWTTSTGYNVPDSCTGSIDWSGGKAVTTGSQVVGPLSSKPTYDYKITCTKTDAIPVEDSVRVRIAPVVSCSANRANAFVGETVVWIASVNSVTQYVLSWSGEEGLSGSALSVSKVYNYGGQKGASVLVTADGISRSAVCATPVANQFTVRIDAAPDLTATAPSVSGTKIGDIYIAGQPITLSGATVTNEGTDTAVIGSTYRTIYQFAYRSTAPTINTDWIDFSDTNFANQTNLDRGVLRDVPPVTFPSESVASGTYWFRVCADQKVDSTKNKLFPGYTPSSGTITEVKLSGDAESESSNCSGAVRANVLNAPSFTVQSTLNGAPTGGAPVSRVSGTTGTNGTTPYTITVLTPVDTVLKAETFTSPGASVANGFLNWGGCNVDSQTSGRNCHVALSIGESRTVTANFESLPDVTFEGRVGSGAWSSNVSASYAGNVELHFKGDRCTLYSASSGVGTAGSNPTTSWSSNLSTSAKTISNTAFTSETVSGLTAGTYTFTLSCQNSAGPVSKTVNVSVGAPPVSCSASPANPLVGQTVTWTADAPSRSAYSWTGTEGVSGSTNPISKIYTIPGTKSATVSIVVNGRSASAPCSVFVAGQPDLTATNPTVSGSKIGDYFIFGTSVALRDATIKNEGTGDAPIGTGYRTLYQFSYSGGEWVDLAPSVASVDTSPLAVELSRSVLGGSMTLSVPGSYRFRICADQDPDGIVGYVSTKGTVTEWNADGTAESEASNCSTGTTIEVRQFPDLVVSKAPAPVQAGELTQGAVYTFTGDIQNAGQTSIVSPDSFNSRFLIDGVPLTGDPSIVGLAKDETKPVVSGNWTATAGSHTLTLCADEPKNDIVELDETNNCSESTILVASTRPVVNPVALTTSSQCEQIALTYSGGTGAGSFELYRKEGSDTLPYELLETKSRLADLRSIDAGLDGGATYFYMVKAISAGGLTSESVRPSSAVARNCTDAKPDLIATKVVVNGALTIGTNLTFTGTVTNSGGSDVLANQSFVNSFTIIPPSPASSIPLREVTYRNGLAKDSEAEVLSTDSWTAVEGTYTIKFCTNTTRTVDEKANDGFNCTTNAFTVVGSGEPELLTATLTADKSGLVAPLDLVSLTATADGSATGGVSYSFDYTNDGVVEVAHVQTSPTSGRASYSTTGGERHTYTNAGKYVARVDLSRGGETAFATVSINARPKLTLTTGPGCQSITTSWGTVEGVANYVVARSFTGLAGSFSDIKTLGSGETSYADTSLTAGSVYYYQLKAVLTDGTSLYSDTLSQSAGASCSQSYALTVVVNGSGNVATSAGEINCGNGATSCGPISYAPGVNVTLTATTEEGVTFTGWSDACSGSQTSCMVTMNTDLQAVGSFSGTPTGGNTGPGAPGAPTVICSARSGLKAGSLITVDIGDTVTWSATPSAGTPPPYTFDWTGSVPLEGMHGQTQFGPFAVDVEYTTSGDKIGSVAVSDVNFVGTPTLCNTTVRVNPEPVCTPGQPNFGLVASVKGIPGEKTMYMDPAVSVTSSQVKVSVVAPSCFTDTITFQDPFTDGKHPKFGGVQTTYNSTHDTLTSVQYDTGTDMSITIQNPNNPVPEGTYTTYTATGNDNNPLPFKVCGSDGTFTQCVSLILEVAPGALDGGGGTSSTPLPIFEEF